MVFIHPKDIISPLVEAFAEAEKDGIVIDDEGLNNYILKRMKGINHRLSEIDDKTLSSEVYCRTWGLVNYIDIRVEPIEGNGCNIFYNISSGGKRFLHYKKRKPSS